MRRYKTTLASRILTRFAAVSSLVFACNTSGAQCFTCTTPDETFTFDNVGIGLTSPGSKLHVVSGYSEGNSGWEGQPVLKLDWHGPSFLTESGTSGTPPNAIEVLGISPNPWPGSSPFIGPLMIMDHSGQIGMKAWPLEGFALNVGGSANVADAVTIGGATSYTPDDKLTVMGDMTLTHPDDSHWRGIRARSYEGVLLMAANTGSTDGSTIELSGPDASGREGQVRLVSHGEAGKPGIQFYNYDPSTGIWDNHMRISTDGKVAIGHESLPTPGNYKLYVDQGGILTQRIKVALPSDPTNWSDFVFDEDYELMPLRDVEKYIAKNKHLPEIPSTAEVHKEGLDLAQMDAKLLQKIEELTLYVIQQQKEIEEMRKKLKN